MVLLSDKYPDPLRALLGLRHHKIVVILDIINGRLVEVQVCKAAQGERGYQEIHFAQRQAVVKGRISI